MLSLCARDCSCLLLRSLILNTVALHVFGGSGSGCPRLRLEKNKQAAQNKLGSSDTSLGSAGVRSSMSANSALLWLPHSPTPTRPPTPPRPPLSSETPQLRSRRLLCCAFFDSEPPTQEFWHVALRCAFHLLLRRDASVRRCTAGRQHCPTCRRRSLSRGRPGACAIPNRANLILYV